jgi:BASS family bile acid:Na+ symporter
VLDFAGRNGPLMLLGGVMIGLLVPPLAQAARPLLGVAVFIFTLGAFLKVDLPSFRAEFSRPYMIVAALIWSAFGVPAVAFGMLSLIGGHAELRDGVMLAMLAPPVGSAAAIAAMLGLSAPLALLMTIATTVVAPFTLPLLSAWMTSTQIAIDPVAMVVRLVIIVGGACLGATLLRRYANRFVTQNPHAMTGIAVLGLILVAIGAMHGVNQVIRANPSHVADYLALAFLVNAGFEVLGTILFMAAGRRAALTMGLVSGNRNVTLIWAAIGPDLLTHPQAELYLAMSVFPIFIMPAATRWLIGRLLAGPASRAMAVPSNATCEVARLAGVIDPMDGNQ